MRRLCAALALTLALVGLTAGSGTQSQYVTSMTFQDGVYPTAGYAGCAATFISSAVADSNENRGACDSLNIGGSSAVRGNMHPLIKFVITDLPDSAVIVRARLYLYTLYPSASAVSNDIGAEAIKLHRLYNAWTEGTGTCAGTADATMARWWSRTGLRWVSAGALPGTLSNNETKYWGPSSTTTPDSATLGSFFGGDTINVATRAGGAFTNDAVGASSAFSPPKSGNNAAKRLGWLVFDVTADVRQWHIGAVQNNGWVAQMDASTNTLTISYASDNYAWVHRRPKLVVEYLDPEAIESASGGGSVRRTIGRTR